MVEQQADRTRLTLPIIDWGQVPLGIAYAIAYGLLFTLAGYIVGLVEFSLWFPAAGLRFAILLIAGWQFAFIAALAEILTQGVLGEWSNWGTNFVWQMIAGIVGPPLIYGAVIWFASQVLKVKIDSVRFSNVGWLCTAALAAPALTAPISTGFLYLADRLPAEAFWPATLSFWIGDAVGVLMLAPPLLLAWMLIKIRPDQPGLSLVDRIRTFSRRGIKPKEQGFIELAVSIVLIAALYWFVTSPQEQPYWYLAFLPLIWLALRFGLSGAVVAVFGLNLLAGWIASQLDDPSQRIDLQLFLIALSLTGLFLGAIVSERVATADRHAKAMAKLAHADRLNSLGALSAAVVHEIGQPVTTLESYAKEAARRIESGELTPSDLDRSVGHLVGETEHIVKSFDEELQKLDNMVVEMGGLAESQLADAIAALVRRDVELAQRVVEQDQRIDAIEDDIHGFVLRMLATRQPVAVDLRIILAALKISSSLERIGDYAKNIAKRTTPIAKVPAMGGTAQSIARMTGVVQGMIKNVLDAYIDRDLDMAADVRARDEEVDQMHTSLFRELLTYMMEDPRNITAATHLVFTAKNVERIGDHATGIAEQVQFMVAGELPGDARPKGDNASFTVVEAEQPNP